MKLRPVEEIQSSMFAHVATRGWVEGVSGRQVGCHKQASDGVVNLNLRTG